MKKENLKDEKIQTNTSETIESENLQKCSQQDSKEKSDEPAWRTRALEFLTLKFDNEETSLLSYQYSRFIDGQWSPWVPYSSYIHFSSTSVVRLPSVILGSLENLEVGVYRFKLLALFKYRDYWYNYNFDPELDLDLYPVLEIKVFEKNGSKGFEVIDCYDIEEKIVKNEI